MIPTETPQKIQPKSKSKLKKILSNKKILFGLIVVPFAVIGTYLLLFSQAATPGVMSFTSDSLIRSNDGRIHIFVRGPDGGAYVATQTAANTQSFSGFSPLGGVVTSTIVPAKNKDGRITIATRSNDNALWINTQKTVNGAFGGWTSLGGAVTSDPIIGSNADGRLQIFVRGTDNAAWTASQTSPNGAFGGWTSLGGNITSNMQVTNDLSGRLELYLEGGEGLGMYRTIQSTPGGAFSGYTRIGGSSAGWTSNAALATGDYTASNIKTRSTIYIGTNTLSEGFGGTQLSSLNASGTVVRPNPDKFIPTSLGGNFTSSPSIAVNKPASATAVPIFQIFGRGSDGMLWTSSYQNSFRNDWRSIGGVIASDPAVIANADGRLQVFVKGNDNALWTLSQTSPGSTTFSAFAKVGGSLASVAALTPNSGTGLNTADNGQGPISFANLEQAKASLGAPADANYVVWNTSWPKTRDLEDVFNSLAPNDILVLPERPEPYVIDSSEGFRAANVKSVTGRNGQLPIVSKYKGLRSARTWFAMARARRGIIGMGPGAVIQMSQSSWTQERQIEDKGSVQTDGWTSPGRTYTKLDGTAGGELVGSQEKVIEAEHAAPFFGNFRMKGRDLGGVAYNGITAKGGSFVRLDLSGAWRGFQAVPNGEAGAISTGGTTNYLISRSILGTRDDAGNRVGSSPIMINTSVGGTIEDTDVSESAAGMLTIWNSSGRHYLKNVNTRFNYGPGLNLEKVQSNFFLEWNGGSIWSDYKGTGGRSPKPADQGTNGKLHFNIFTEGASAQLLFRNIDIDNGATAGAVNIQSYGNQQQKLSDIKAYNRQGNAFPLKAYGTMK